MSYRSQQQLQQQAEDPVVEILGRELDDTRARLAEMYTTPTRETHTLVENGQYNSFKNSFESLPKVVQNLVNQYHMLVQNGDLEQAFIVLKSIEGLQKVLPQFIKVDIEIKDTITMFRNRHGINDEVIKKKLKANCKNTLNVKPRNDQYKERFACSDPAGFDETCTLPAHFPVYIGMQVCCQPFNEHFYQHIKLLEATHEKLSPVARSDFRKKHAYFTEGITKATNLPEHMHSFFLHKYLPDIAWIVLYNNPNLFDTPHNTLSNLSVNAGGSSVVSVTSSSVPLVPGSSAPLVSGAPSGSLASGSSSLIPGATGKPRSMSTALPVGSGSTSVPSGGGLSGGSSGGTAKQRSLSVTIPSSVIKAPVSNPHVNIRDSNIDLDLPFTHFYTYLVSTAMYIQWVRLMVVMLLEVKQFHDEIFQVLIDHSPISKDQTISTIDLHIKIIKALLFFVITSLTKKIEGLDFKIELLVHIDSKDKTLIFDIAKDAIKRLCENHNFQLNVVHEMITSEVHNFNVMDLYERKSYSHFIFKHLLRDIPNADAKLQFGIFIARMTLQAAEDFEPSWNLTQVMKYRLSKLFAKEKLTIEFGSKLPKIMASQNDLSEYDMLHKIITP